MPSSLHSRVIDDVGLAVIDGRTPAGTVLHSDDLARSQGVSRSVVREVVRVLAAMGLVESVKRIGIRVLPAARWNVYDPTVIRWRLSGAGKGAQLRSLSELRSSVEPMAAELAAQHCPAAASAELMAVAAQMRTAGRAGDLAHFLELDILFHRLVLHGSGNEMFARLDEPIAAVLSGRTELGLMPTNPHETALQWHVDVADAIQGGHPAKARAAMELIMRRTISEVEPSWADTPRPYSA
ncbi:FadR/GntR family transcriptional regulator [Glaciibacter psychrotolerans]|uniref:DNA-binding FadR family transcriptional regulator n=1 Tax=Glaciibacter psychrotolerans TaxID=670054 RepID=A0A7Z0J6F2_9MICO|nr:FCD domain-containing protein [Leifsonia psychrotolerans]NYJ19868.1 DNA-binding FadR family transcriptional regulator [Leifsonia psychrotolerans]